MKNINEYTIEEKVAQMLMFAFHGTEYSDSLNKLITELKIGGIIYFSRNITSLKQTKELNQMMQKNSETPLFIAIDQEGGIVQRVIEGMTIFPGQMAVCASNMSNYDLCYSVGEDLRNIGFNMDFAPVADCNNNPRNPVINSRAFSDNPITCGKYTISGSQGFQDAKIISCAKHFPGHGDTSVDSHLSLPIVNKEIDKLEKCEFVPFKMAIDSGIVGIMASHILYKEIDDKFPATLSKKVITDLLKNKLGFKGLIVTDSLTMGAIYNNYTKNEVVRLAANAGIDLLVFCGKADLNEQIEIYNAFVEEVKIGNIPIERINESFEKIMKLKEKYITNKDIRNKFTKEEKINIGKEISEKSITLVKNENQDILPILNKNKVLVISPVIKVFSLVDNDDNNNYYTIGKSLKAKGIDCDEIIYEENSDILKKCMDFQKKYDKIILATYNVRENDYQKLLFDNLDHNKTIVVSMRSPYDILYLNDVKTYICIYETSKIAYESLTKCLLNNKFFGLLPVKF